MLDDEQSVQEKLSNVDLPSYGGVVAHSYLPSNWLSALEYLRRPCWGS
jgi:KDO II ethanolaminephosphotransferase